MLGAVIGAGSTLAVLPHPNLLPLLNDYRISRPEVELEAVVDCRDPEAPGLSSEELLSDNDYGAGQALAEAAIAEGAEGILVPSATGLGDNLVVFPEQLRRGSRLEMAGYRDELCPYPRGDDPDNVGGYRGPSQDTEALALARG